MTSGTTTPMGAIRVPGQRRKSAALRVLIVRAVIVCGLSVPPGVVFAKAPLGKQWPAAQQVSFDAVDHSAFEALLRKYVDEDGYVDYRLWQRLIRGGRHWQLPRTLLSINLPEGYCRTLDHQS